MSPSERLAELDAGANPLMVAKLQSGFVVMNSSQYFRGYCLLLAYPQVEKLNDIDGEARSTFLNDMARVGDALLAVTGCRRINYSIYGNLDPFLHAHIIPRYDSEPDEYRTGPPMSVPAELRDRAEYAFSPTAHGELLDALRSRLA